MNVNLISLCMIAIYMSIYIAKVSAKPYNINLGLPYDAAEKRLTSNPELLLESGKCFINQGPCTDVGEELKAVIPHALQTQCSECSRSEIKLAIGFIDALRTNHPEFFEQMADFYGIHGQNREEFEAFVRKYKNMAVIPHALQTKCSECSPSEIKLAFAFIKALRTNYPEFSEQMADFYGIRGQNRKEFEAFVSKYS